MGECIVVDKMKMKLSDIYEQLSTQVNAINPVVEVMIHVLEELETCEVSFQQQQNTMNMIKEQATTKDPMTLLNEVQAIDFQSILTQLEKMDEKTTPLKFPKHQHEVKQRKQN